MPDGLDMEEGSLLAEEINDLRVGVPDAHAGEVLGAFLEDAVIVNRVRDLEAVLAADHIVVRAVSRSGVDDAGTGVVGNMRAKDGGNVKRQVGVMEAEELKIHALGAADDMVLLHAGALHGALIELLPEDKALCVIALGLHDDVVELRVEADAAVSGHGPGGGGPDDDREGAGAFLGHIELRENCLLVDGAEAHVDGQGVDVLVLDLSLCKRGAAVAAPVDRLEAAYKIAVFDDLSEAADDVRLGVEIHGEVGMIPVADYAEALEVSLLGLNLGLRVLAALLAELSGGYLAAGLSDLLLNLELNREPVAVPARDIGSIIAGERLRLEDDVLQDLVDGMPEMDIAIGVRRAVVENEALSASPCRTDCSVEILLVPGVQHSRLPLRQVGAHGEFCVGKIQSCLVLVVAHFG